MRNRAPVNSMKAMNIQGGKSRVQAIPVSMYDAAFPAVSPSSGKHTVEKEIIERYLQRSQPIPIKKCKPDSRDLEERVDSSEYDWATWRMYVRITNARRLRAFAQSTCSNSSAMSQQEQDSLVDDEEIYPEPNVVPHDLCVRPSSMEDYPHGGVFILDSM